VRVLFVAAHLKTGGVERQWSLLLPALRDAGFDVRLLTLTAEGDFFPFVQQAGIFAVCAGMRGGADVSGLRRAVRASEWKPDVVVTNSVIGHVVGHAIARRAGAKHAATEHGISSVAADHPRRMWARRLIASRVDRVIGVTPRQVPYLTGLGYRADRIVHVWNGIPDLAPQRTREEVRGELGARPGDFAALLVATLRPEKRADVFVDSIGCAHAADPAIRGFIAGRGPELALTRRRAAESDGVVSVLGDRADVPDLLTAADVVCLTSETEALPMVVIEAMSLGRPVIATDVGGTRDLILPAETGILIPPNDRDSLVHALHDARARPEVLREYGEAGRRRQQSFFTLEKMVDGYARVLTDLARSPRVAATS
jgi:glycosyltransferase involved in cell wall biosynthesis